MRCLNAGKLTPSPIDAYFGGVYYIGPIFTACRGLPKCEEYYKTLLKEVDYRAKNKLGPITPEGHVVKEKYRLIVEGPPNWTSFREFWKMFYDEGAVVVASSYTKVGGLYDQGFRHDFKRPFESMAEYCLGCYTNMHLPGRIDLLEKYAKEYHADGFLNSIKSCNSFLLVSCSSCVNWRKRPICPGDLWNRIWLILAILVPPILKIVWSHIFKWLMPKEERERGVLYRNRSGFDNHQGRLFGCPGKYYRPRNYKFAQ